MRQISDGNIGDDFLYTMAKEFERLPGQLKQLGKGEELERTTLKSLQPWFQD